MLGSHPTPSNIHLGTLESEPDPKPQARGKINNLDDPRVAVGGIRIESRGFSRSPVYRFKTADEECLSMPTS